MRESSISISHVCTAEQLADIVTAGALTTISWKSLMLLFHTHAPPKLDVNDSMSLSASLSRHVDRPQLTARLLEWALGRKAGKPSYEVANQRPAWANMVQNTDQMAPSSRVEGVEAQLVAFFGTRRRESRYLLARSLPSDNEGIKH